MVVSATCAVLGFGPLAVREVARLSVRTDWAELRGFLFLSSLAVIGSSIAAAAGFALLAMGTEVIEAHYRREISLACLLVLPLAVLIYLRGVLQGFGQVLASQIPIDVLRPIILVAGLTLLFIAGRSATTMDYLIVTIAAAGLAACTAAAMAWHTVRLRVAAVPKAYLIRKWSGAATTFLAISLLGVLAGEISTLLLGWLSKPHQVGLYQPVARIAPLMLIALQAVSIPFAPRVVALWEQGDYAELRRMTWLVTSSTLLATVLFCMVIVWLAPLFLQAFGEAFLDARQAILVVAAGQIFYAACGPVELLLSMTGHQRTVVRCQMTGLAANLVVGAWLIPEWGANGAAVAFTIGTVTWNISMLIAVRRRLGFDASLFGTRHLLLSPKE